jgi:uncharacterized LabA/DUF88 family protein
VNKKTIKGIKSKRSIHLIDIENLCVTGDLTVEMVAAVRDAYFAQVSPASEDLFVIAASHHNMEAAVFGWPGGFHGFRSGKDGADIVLAQMMLEDNLADRFESVFLASGDGGLAPFASSLRAKGCQVQVVSRVESVSWAMRFSSDSVQYLQISHALAA